MTTTAPRPLPKHPAKFSAAILDELVKIIDPFALTLDPFGGVGKIHDITASAVSSELEFPWAVQGKDRGGGGGGGGPTMNVVADALRLPFPDNTFEQVVTSPCYGNRMADSHTPKESSRRRTYFHMMRDAGYELRGDSAARLQWGKRYRDFHEAAWGEVVRVLEPDGMFVLNVSDHIRNHVRQKVVGWHIGAVRRLGMKMERYFTVDTPRDRGHAHRDVRVECEVVAVFRK